MPYPDRENPGKAQGKKAFLNAGSRLQIFIQPLLALG